jgi:hypothetical protein
VAAREVPLSRCIAPGPETRLKLIAADYDVMAMRAAALDLQQADELARAFASNWLGGLDPVARYFTILTVTFGHPGHSKVRLS